MAKPYPQPKSSCNVNPQNLITLVKGKTSATKGHTNGIHTHTKIQKWVCVSWRDSRVVTLLMGPYGHKTNTNCSFSLSVIRSWRCWFHSDGETNRRERARDCGLNSLGGRSITCSLFCPQQLVYWGFQYMSVSGHRQQLLQEKKLWYSCIALELSLWK